MIPFLKLTTEACRRMRTAILSKQIDRIGRIWPYQSRIRVGRVFRNQLVQPQQQSRP